MTLGDYLDGYVSELKRGATTRSPTFRTSYIGEATYWLCAFAATYAVIHYASEDESEKRELKQWMYGTFGKALLIAVAWNLALAVYESVNEQ